MIIEDFNLKNIGDWSCLNKFALILGSCFLLIYLAYQLLINKELNTLYKEKEQYQILQQNFTQQKKQIQKIPIIKKHWQAKANEFLREEQQFSAQITTPIFLAMISQFSKMCGVTIDSLEPLTAKSQKYFMILPMQISISASFEQIYLFLNQLNALNGIVIVDNFKIAPINSGKEKLHIDLVAKVYQLSSFAWPVAVLRRTGPTISMTESESIGEGEARFYANKILHNPFQISVNNNVSHRYQAEPLTTFPAAALKTVGTIAQGDQLWTLILAPNGQVYRVRK